MATTTREQRLVEDAYRARTGSSLRDFIREQRRDGQAWRPIVDEVTDVLGDDLTPSLATFNNWYRYLDEVPEEAA